MAALAETFNKWTRTFYETEVAEDQAHRARPFLKAVEPYVRKRSLSKTITYPLKTGVLTGEFYDPDDDLASATGELGTDCVYTTKFAQAPCRIVAQDRELNKGNSVQIVDLWKTYHDETIEALSDLIAEAYLTAQAGSYPTSFLDAVNDTDDYAGISLASYPKWRAFIIESKLNTAVPISPTVSNVQQAIMYSNIICKRTVDLIVTTPQVWWKLKSQIQDKTQITLGPTGTKLVQYGFQVFEIDQVPVIHDSLIYAEDYVANQATRTAAKGHQMLGINFKYTYPLVHASRYFTWDEQGWVKPPNKDAWLNHLYWWGVVVCNQRRANFRIFGIDPDQAAGSYTDFDLADNTNYATLTA